MMGNSVSTVPANVMRISRRSVLGGLATVPAFALLAKSFSAKAQDGGVVTMVTDTAGLGDQNFNDLTWAGVQRGAAEFGFEAQVLESLDQGAYVPNLTDAAESSVLVVATGFLLTDAVLEVAPLYPDVPFLLIDDVADVENVRSVTFREHEGAFLGGVAAALTTKTGVLGIIGGMEVPPVIRYEVGFIAGARSINPDIEVLVNYVGSFGDPAAGKEATLAQFDQNADVVFPIAGATGIGSFEAAIERNIPNSVIGADANQSHLGPEFQLCYVGKGVDVAAYDAIKAVSEGNFEAGAVDLGLAEGGMLLGDPDGKLSPQIMGYVEAYRQAIIDGSIQIPADRDQLESFEPVQLEPVAVGTPAATPGA